MTDTITFYLMIANMLKSGENRNKHVAISVSHQINCVILHNFAAISEKNYLAYEKDAS